MVSLDDRLGADARQGPRESVPIILGMPAEFMRALEELDAVGSTDERRDWNALRTWQRCCTSPPNVSALCSSRRVPS